MDNFKLRYSELFAKKMKHDELAEHRHYKILQVGSGESGYSSFALLNRSRHFLRDDMLVVTETPVQRPRFGQLFYALHNYERLDFEAPLIKVFKHDKMMFDQIVDFDLEKKRVTFLGSDFITYDYLMLNCGQQVDFTGLEALRDKIDFKDNFYYSLDDFNSFEKMREDFEFFQNQPVFNLIAQKRTDNVWQLVSTAFLLRSLYSKAEVHLYFENSCVSENQLINDKILEQLDRNGISICLNAKLTVEGDADTVSLKINDDLDITDEVIYFAFNKKIPEFLEAAKFPVDRFDLETLQHKDHPFIFTSGSLVYPNSSLGSKYSQARIQVDNLERSVSKEWYNKNVELLRYKHFDDAMVHKTFDHISKLYGNGKADGLIKAKIRSLRHLNIDLFKYLYVLPRGWGLKGLFR